MRRVSESLLAELTGGALDPDMPLDPVGEIAERHGVSPRTIRAAVDALLQAGYLVRRGDSTIHVAAPDTVAALS
jgi:DNA-binding GntR family transcriptional regulator